MDDDLDTPKAIRWTVDELIAGGSSDAELRHSALRIVSQVLGVDFLANS
jgi:hypothetical protein